MKERRERAVVIGLLIGFVFIAACGHEKEAAPEAIPVTVHSVAVASGGSAGAYSANIVAETHVDLAFKVNGYVQSILQVKGSDGKPRNLQAGDPVTTGAILATVKDDTYRNTLTKAQSDLANSRATLSKTKADFGRYTHLLQERVVSRADYDAAKQHYDSAQASVGAAQAMVQQAQVDLEDCKLKSPMSALVLDRKIEVGTLVAPNTVGFQIGDTAKVKVVFGVPGSIVGGLKSGAAITSTVDAFPGQVFQGSITKVAAVADPNTRVFDVEATIPNAEGRLRVGMIASIRLPATVQPASAVVVPTRSIVRPPDDPNGYAVYVAEKGVDGKMVAELKKVAIGPVVGDQVSVESGLDSGAQVIIRGADIVFNGASINIVP